MRFIHVTMKSTSISVHNQRRNVLKMYSRSGYKVLCPINQYKIMTGVFVAGTLVVLRF